MRLRGVLTGICAALCACVASLALSGVGTAAAAQPAALYAQPAALSYDTLAYDALTQSHPGACARSTVNVAQAVADLSANGVLGHYAALVGVRAGGSALLARMRRALVVVPVAGRTVTANHGCTTDGLIFPIGSRTLHRGETVGVALSSKLRARLCRPGTGRCERRVLTVHAVFPTNCWNLDQGTVRVVLHLRRPQPVKPTPKPKPKPKPKPVAKPELVITRPSARVATSCGTGSAGSSAITLTNGPGANRGATFVVNGKRYGPVAPGHSVMVSVALRSGASTRIRVSSGGQLLLDQSVPADPCPVSAPSATAAVSCPAGGVVVALSNAASATADASFEVNGTSYGPLQPGASQSVTLPLAPGASAEVTVTSGAQTLIGDTSYTNACIALPSVKAQLGCAPHLPSETLSGGGTLMIELTDAASAGLPAAFTVTVSGNTAGGYGPTAVGPVAVGATQTLSLPVDASGNPVQVTVDSAGMQRYSQTFSGCPGVVTGG